MVTIDTVHTRQLIAKWHERACIDYSDLYVREYIAYNAWFRKVTQSNEDHEAIRRLLKRFVIWDDYIHGRTLLSLGPVIEEIVTITHRTPIPSSTALWDGIVKDVFDWQGLIYFWYSTRCQLFHGLTIPGSVPHNRYIQLSYESLRIFMNEITRRMRYCFTDADFDQLTEVKSLILSDNGVLNELKGVEARLYQKFIHSTDVWSVDMVRA